MLTNKSAYEYYSAASRDLAVAIFIMIFGDNNDPSGNRSVDQKAVALLKIELLREHMKGKAQDCPSYARAIRTIQQLSNRYGVTVGR